ncbi:hypothetical protein ROSINTL182_07099 [Roseburia intestinalis L1-82]|uniref:Uncharacterized protein n=1 Tax=Roseburia intestinalis L1-82 TaxID=536231 RepID=C7GB15_9FIRM|nr:hypothetical protein ROSINTL182_07099 [Roseburia intestinalis L1-82]
MQSLFSSCFCLFWTYFVHFLFIFHRKTQIVHSFLFIFPIDFLPEKRYILLVSKIRFLHTFYKILEMTAFPFTDRQFDIT